MTQTLVGRDREQSRELENGDNEVDYFHLIDSEGISGPVAKH